jgi:hypothetical protein
MPLTHEVLHDRDEWFTSDTSTGPLAWNTRHIALGDESADSQWILEDANDDACAFVVYSGWPNWTGAAINSYDSRVAEIRARSEYLSVEFDALSKRWHKDTRHMSLVSEKVTHPAYLRIIGMGEAAIPLLLEALRDRPAHWFTALRATANTDPASIDDSPSLAREAWINWGIAEGYID